MIELSTGALKSNAQNVGPAVSPSKLLLSHPTEFKDDPESDIQRPA